MASNSDLMPQMRRITQISDSHCGPAVLAMLLSNLKIKVWQRDIVEAAEVGKRIMKYGMTVMEMARAVKRLVPEAQFWMKEGATIAELKKLVNDYQLPVGVEWQGEFGKYSDGEDDGHFSVVVGVDLKENEIVIADPFGPFAEEDREFSVSDFENRWWDYNDVRDEDTGGMKEVEDYHMMFVITDKNDNRPEELEMMRG